jgi:hypothetical protein
MHLNWQLLHQHRKALEQDQAKLIGERWKEYAPCAG